MIKVLMRFAAVIGFLLMISISSRLSAQIAQAEPPVLQWVSINPETGFIEINWLPSPSPNVDYYQVLEYLPDRNGGVPIGGPVYGLQTALTYDLPHFQSVAFIVEGVYDLGDDINAGYWSTIDSTIFLKAIYDTCQSVMSLEWNDYNTWRGSIDRYTIYRYMAPGMYEIIATVPEGTNTFEMRNLLPNVTYDFFVEAVNTDGRKSTSNRSAVETNMPEIPVSINADYATISPDNTIQLSFSVQASTGMTSYSLLRSNTYDGIYSNIGNINTAESHFEYTDNVPFTSNVRYYKVEVINDCGVSAIESNRSSNIILQGSFINMIASLEWNEYRDWLGGVEAYRVIRTIGRNSPVTDTVYTGGNTMFTNDVSNLINYSDPAEGLVCYTIEATQNTNPLGILAHSTSNRVCFSVNPEIRMPNAFIPNDQEQLNQEFAPVFSFMPEHYEMTIYNRLGLKIWEGTQPWDGRVNGKFVPEGVYLYFIRVFSYTSEITELNGKVTVLYR